MIIVTGHLVVDSDARDSYLNGCRQVIEAARGRDGCIDFAVSPDLVDTSRINICEVWETRAALEAFRGAGPPSDQMSVIESFHVNEHVVSAPHRTLETT